MKYFLRIFFSSALLLFLQFCEAMDKPEPQSTQTVHFCLMDEKRCYNLAFCKVKASLTLFKAYCADRKNFPQQKCKISLSGISHQEMHLFDRALDADIDSKNSQSFSKFFQTELNGEQRRMLTVAAGERDEEGTKKFDAPCLSVQLADEWISSKSDLGCKCIRPLFSELVTYCKVAMIKEDLNNQKIKPSDSYTYVSNKLSITGSKANAVWPEDVFLTSFDDSKPEKFSLNVQSDCLKGAIDSCFNHTSDVLVYVQGQGIHSFDIKSKKVINSLYFASELPSSTKIRFNRDSSRLVCSYYGGYNLNNLIVCICDTSDLSCIKRICFFPQRNVERSLLRINFSYLSHDVLVPSADNAAMFDIVIVSASNVTMFFDAKSGAFLGIKKSEKNARNFGTNSDVEHVAVLSIPDSPTTFIGRNHCNNSSVSFYNHMIGQEIGTITYPEPKLQGIGLTKNLASLVAVFEHGKAIKTDLFDDKKLQAILDDMRFVDWYILSQLYFAKKSKTKHDLSPSLFDYIKKIFNMDNFIEKHF